MGRLARELRARHSPGDVERALSALVVQDVHEEKAVVVTRASEAEPKSRPLFGPEHRPGGLVRIAPSVYAETPTAAARVRLLEAAMALGERLEVHAPLASGETHTGRLLFDPPRRAAELVGAHMAEPGDRFDGRFVHAFFDDEPLVVEASRAGLRFIGRRGAWITLSADGPPNVDDAAPFAAEFGRALAIVREVERVRLREPAERAVDLMRGRGSTRTARGPIGRARLRRAIGWVDAPFPGGPNCFRRVLAELALDAGAASDTLVFGLDVDRTGHVAFKDVEERSFDVAFEVPPMSS
jgi:hypothetical protein